MPCCALLRFAALSCAALRWALLRFASLSWASLSFAPLDSALLGLAPLRLAMLRFATLAQVLHPPLNGRWALPENSLLQLLKARFRTGHPVVQILDHHGDSTVALQFLR
jgi:uncharacterized protein YjbI with pentapeptide repeats